MTAPGEVTLLQVGDTVPVGTVLASLIIMGIVTDVNNPNMFAAAIQAYQSQAVLTVPVLQGVTGPPGQPSFALQFQNAYFTSPASLPTGLGNTTDLGKYWVIAVTDQNNNVVATEMWVWFGTAIGFKNFPVGSPGPPGPTPLIHPEIKVEAPGNGQGPNGVDSWIAVSGTVSNPTFSFHIAAPQGIPGPAGQLSTSPDVDFTTVVPAPGNALVCTSRVVPGSPTSLAISTAGTGGTLAAGSWFYLVTTIVPNGESLQSNEVEAATLGSTSANTLTWFAPGGGGGTGYKIYRSSSLFGTSYLIGTINDITTTTFTDTGFVGVPGSPPSVGVIAGRSIWGPAAQTVLAPKLYTIPQSAFTAQQGIGGSKQAVCTFAVPQQPWPWKPFVCGQMRIFGFNISFTPLLVGADVLLGNPTTGQLVAKGQGNSLGAVTIIPQASTSTNTSQAMTPTNGVGLVPANHTGTQGTLYVSLENQGMAGTYDFNPAGSQLVVLVIPTPPS